MSIDLSVTVSTTPPPRRRPFTAALLAALSLALCGCGVDTEVPAVSDQPAPLTPATPSRERTAPQAEVPIAQLKLATPVGLRPSDATVHVTSSLPEGTPVQFLIGELGCGIMVVAQGVATVHGGGFDVPYDPDDARNLPSSTIFFRVSDGAVCDESSAGVMAAEAPLPGTVNLDDGQPTYAGCWLFGTP